MKRLLILAALLPAACRRAAPPAAPGVPAFYRAADGSFSAHLPADWRVDETPGENRKAAFYGPSGGEKAFTQLMGIYFHPAASPATAARDYLASAQDATAPIREIPVGEETGHETVMNRSLPDIHAGMQKVITRTVVVAAKGGFFSLEHTWPAASAPAPAFDELVRSFQPASAGQ